MMVINNREEVEGIIDTGSQIIAMSKAVCHDIGLAYNPSIKLNMQLANGEVDQSLGLSRNVPCKISTITLYLQIHIIWSPAYDCKGNLTDLRRILHLSLAKGNPK
jgi:hypothetical protein